MSKQLDGSMVSAARGIEGGPESERTTSPRPVSTTRAASNMRWIYRTRIYFAWVNRCPRCLLDPFHN